MERVPVWLDATGSELVIPRVDNGIQFDIRVKLGKQQIRNLRWSLPYDGMPRDGEGE